jgi:hypothetical protein
MSLSGCVRLVSVVPVVAVIALSGGRVSTQTDVRPVNDLPNP